MTSETFLLDPKNRRVLEGKRRLFSLDILMLPFMVPFVLVGVGMVGYTIYEGYQKTTFERSGVDVEGVVTRLWVEKGSDSDSYHVAYAYGLDPTDDKTNTGQSTVDEAAYKTLQKDGRISVRYLKTDPSRSIIPGQGTSIGLLLGMTVFWNLVTGVMSWHIRKMALRQRRLRRGRQLPGEIIGATVMKDSDGDNRLTLDYRFTSPEGRQITASASRTRHDLSGETVPRPGTPVVVQYADDGDSEPL
jgi:hypothetical protein